jgi:hypothetical protein
MEQFSATLASGAIILVAANRHDATNCRGRDVAAVAAHVDAGLEADTVVRIRILNAILRQ